LAPARFSNDAGHNFTDLFVLACLVANGKHRRALTDFAAEGGLTKVANTDQVAIGFLDGCVRHVVETLRPGTHPALPTDHKLFGAPVLIPAARIAVVLLQCLLDVFDGKLVGQQLGRIEIDLILANRSAERQNVGHAFRRL
jgi:hypothetical protein